MNRGDQVRFRAGATLARAFDIPAEAVGTIGTVDGLTTNVDFGEIGYVTGAPLADLELVAPTPHRDVGRPDRLVQNDLKS